MSANDRSQDAKTLDAILQIMEGLFLFRFRFLSDVFS